MKTRSGTQLSQRTQTGTQLSQSNRIFVELARTLDSYFQLNTIFVQFDSFRSFDALTLSGGCLVSSGKVSKKSVGL